MLIPQIVSLVANLDWDEDWANKDKNNSGCRWKIFDENGSDIGVNITDPTSKETTASFSSPGKYKAYFIASDGAMPCFAGPKDINITSEDDDPDPIPIPQPPDDDKPPEPAIIPLRASIQKGAKIVKTVDCVIDFDTTGSMGGAIKGCCQRMEEIVKSLFRMGGNVRVALVTHGNHRESKHINCPLTPARYTGNTEIDNMEKSTALERITTAMEAIKANSICAKVGSFNGHHFDWTEPNKNLFPEYYDFDHDSSPNKYLYDGIKHKADKIPIQFFDPEWYRVNGLEWPFYSEYKTNVKLNSSNTVKESFDVRYPVVNSRELFKKLTPAKVLYPDYKDSSELKKRTIYQYINAMTWSEYLKWCCKLEYTESNATGHRHLLLSPGGSSEFRSQETEGNENVFASIWETVREINWEENSARFYILVSDQTSISLSVAANYPVDESLVNNRKRSIGLGNTSESKQDLTGGYKKSYHKAVNIAECINALMHYNCKMITIATNDKMPYKLGTTFNEILPGATFNVKSNAATVVECIRSFIDKISEKFSVDVVLQNVPDVLDVTLDVTRFPEVYPGTTELTTNLYVSPKPSAEQGKTYTFTVVFTSKEIGVIDTVNMSVFIK